MNNYPLFDSYEKIKTYCHSREPFYHYILQKSYQCFLANDAINRDGAADDLNMNAYITFIDTDTPDEEGLRYVLNEDKFTNGYVTLKSKKDGKFLAFVSDRSISNLVHVFFIIDSQPIVVSVWYEDREMDDSIAEIICDAIMINKSTPILNTIIDFVDKSNNEYLLLNF